MKVQLEPLCPLLGARVNQDKPLAYPTPDNQCYAHNRVSPLTLDEQQALCLSPNFHTCRFYLAHQSRSVATQKAGESLTLVSTPRPPYRPAALTVIIAAIVFLTLCGGLLLALGVPQAIALAVIPKATPTQTKVPTRTPTFTPVPPTDTPRPPTLTPTPTPTVPPTPTPVVYTVQPGDALSAIAARFGVSVQAIMEANGISDARLVRVGTRLIIPHPNPASVAPQASPTRK